MSPCNNYEIAHMNKSVTKLDLNLAQIIEAIQAFKFPPVDLIVGIASGGTHPARLIADHLHIPVRFMHINFRHADNTPKGPEPRLLKSDDIPPQYKTLLLIDDVSVSGKTMNVAKSQLQGRTIHTFVLKGQADYVLFPDIKTCVNWPWK